MVKDDRARDMELPSDTVPPLSWFQQRIDNQRQWCIDRNDDLWCPDSTPTVEESRAYLIRKGKLKDGDIVNRGSDDETYGNNEPRKKEFSQADKVRLYCMLTRSDDQCPPNTAAVMESRFRMVSEGKMGGS